jgi:coenzyme PQQ precursor peptide PqqA
MQGIMLFSAKSTGDASADLSQMEEAMDWTTPSLCEVAVGMEITSYATAGL